MLYTVILTYLRPVDEVHQYLEQHKTWLAEHIGAGAILVAGPLEDRSGGLLLASCGQREQLDRILALDPYVVHRVVSVAVHGCVPSLRMEAFPVQWSAQAQAIAQS